MSTEDELRLRHLADIQSTINRLSQNSFTIRGWSVTLVSVFVAVLFASRLDLGWLALITAVPALIFWWLDAYYVWQEKLFRALYTAAAKRILRPEQELPVDPFDMDVARYRVISHSLVRVMLLPHVLAIPATLAGLVLVLAIAKT